MSDFIYKNKITNKAIGVTKEAVQDAIKETKGEVLGYRVYGRAKGFEIVDGDNGESNRYVGEFEAINALTGEIFRSKTLFLPQLASDILEDQLMNSNEKDPVQGEKTVQGKKGMIKQKTLTFEKQIEFGIDVSATPSDSATGYEWGAQPIVETKQEDPFKALKGNMKAMPKPANFLAAA